MAIKGVLLISFRSHLWVISENHRYWIGIRETNSANKFSSRISRLKYVITLEQDFFKNAMDIENSYDYYEIFTNESDLGIK